MEKMKKVAIEAAKKAGKNAHENFFKQHRVRLKTPKDLVTEVDVANEKIILDIIKKNFPDHTIIGEESGESTGTEYTWFVDPVDGTTNYSVQNPFFDISIGVAKDNEPVIACVYAPMIDELFFAQKGKGAFMNGKRIRVSNESDIGKSLLVYCHGSEDKEIQRLVKIFAKLKPISRDFNRMRAGALELSFVAAGRIGAYISNGLQPWDVAAGSLLVREAGGQVTDFQGNRWDLSKRDIIASNDKIHNKLVTILKEI